jgi:hypothetical protein
VLLAFINRDKGYSFTIHKNKAKEEFVMQYRKGALHFCFIDHSFSLCFLQNEGRGLKDPEGVKRKKRRQEEAERKAFNDGQGGGGGLKVITKGFLMFLSTAAIFN